MSMKGKMEKILKVQSDMQYLKEEFASKPLYSNRDGVVEFEVFMEWLSECEYHVEHMIQVAKLIKEI